MTDQAGPEREGTREQPGGPSDAPAGTAVARSLAREIFSAVAGKWSLALINVLAGRTLRFTELRRAVPGISQKMLTQTLRGLERDGLVRRTVYATVPPRVEYALTDAGRARCAPE